MTLLLIPVEALLVIVAMGGFGQGWNIELEVPVEEAKRRYGGNLPPSSPKPATA